MSSQHFIILPGQKKQKIFKYLRKLQDSQVLLFNRFFGIRKNIIIERVKFKHPEELAEQFIAIL